jgi:hypothetical protein
VPTPANNNGPALEGLGIQHGHQAPERSFAGIKNNEIIFWAAETQMTERRNAHAIPSPASTGFQRCSAQSQCVERVPPPEWL